MGRRAIAIAAVPVVVCLALDLIWLVRFRWGYPTEWDESGYLAIAVRNTNALIDHGPIEFARVVETQPSQAPLVPGLATPVLAVLARASPRGSSSSSASSCSWWSRPTGLLGGS